MWKTKRKCATNETNRRISQDRPTEKQMRSTCHPFAEQQRFPKCNRVTCFRHDKILLRAAVLLILLGIIKVFHPWCLIQTLHISHRPQVPMKSALTRLSAYEEANTQRWLQNIFWLIMLLLLFIQPSSDQRRTSDIIKYGDDEVYSQLLLIRTCIIVCTSTPPKIRVGKSNVSVHAYSFRIQTHDNNCFVLQKTAYRMAVKPLGW